MQCIEADPHPQVQKLFELTQKYRHKLDTSIFRKDFSTLVGEGRNGEVIFGETFFEGEWWPSAKRETAVLDGTHMTKAGHLYRLGEMRRIFKNGDEERRFPPGQERLRETVRSEDGENPFNTVIRLLAEEAGIYDPDLAMLEPLEAALWRILSSSSPIRVRGKRVIERKKSFAYPGFVSEYDLWLYSYTAPDHHFSDGPPLVTEDNGVMIEAQWYRID